MAICSDCQHYSKDYGSTGYCVAPCPLWVSFLGNANSVKATDYADECPTFIRLANLD